METPNEILARRIAERLVAEGLVPATRSGSLASQLATGSLKAEDWPIHVQPVASAKAGADAE
jgi:hypothetical protein